MCFNALEAISDISFNLHGNFSDRKFLGGDINMRTCHIPYDIYHDALALIVLFQIEACFIFRELSSWSVFSAMSVAQQNK